MKRSDFTSRDGNDKKGYKTNLDDEPQICSMQKTSISVICDERMDSYPSIATIDNLINTGSNESI